MKAELKKFASKLSDYELEMLCAYSFEHMTKEAKNHIMYQKDIKIGNINVDVPKMIVHALNEEEIVSDTEQDGIYIVNLQRAEDKLNNRVWLNDNVVSSIRKAMEIDQVGDSKDEENVVHERQNEIDESDKLDKFNSVLGNTKIARELDDDTYVLSTEDENILEEAKDELAYEGLDEDKDYKVSFNDLSDKIIVAFVKNAKKDETIPDELRSSCTHQVYIGNAQDALEHRIPNGIAGKTYCKLWKTPVENVKQIGGKCVPTKYLTQGPNETSAGQWGNEQKPYGSEKDFGKKDEDDNWSKKKASLDKEAEDINGYHITEGGEAYGWRIVDPEGRVSILGRKFANTPQEVYEYVTKHKAVAGLNKKAKIVEVDGRYQVQSKNGKNMGTYDTEEEAKKRQEQLENFSGKKSKSKDKDKDKDDKDKEKDDKKEEPSEDKEDDDNEKESDKEASLNKEADMEDETALMPEIVAETVYDEFMSFVPEELYESVYEMRDGYIDTLADRARSIYEANEDFRKKLNASGDRGRDTLYMFMRHWLSSLVNKGASDLYQYIPSGFKIGKEASLNKKATTQTVGGIRSILMDLVEMKQGQVIGDDPWKNVWQEEVDSYIQSLGFSEEHFNKYAFSREDATEVITDFAQENRLPIEPDDIALFLSDYYSQTEMAV